MNQLLNDWVQQVVGARGIVSFERVQSLWSGYGEIVRLQLDGPVSSAVLKHVAFPSEAKHPRGWHNDFSHRRKVRSYEVEMAFYAGRASRCDEYCRVAHCYGATTLGKEHVLLLEDLNEAGFPVRKSSLRRAEVEACLRWLAHFHATFLFEPPDDLWPTGTYWHLATRPDEWQAMAEGELKQVAATLDARLNATRFQTLVHGDAKVANFCFSQDGHRVAAVDFQYVGGGCGIKDVAYLLGSCLNEQQCADWEEALLGYYFSVLHEALGETGSDVAALEVEWREMYALAWADFDRFLAGWMPTHWKINAYSRKQVSKALAYLQENNQTCSSCSAAIHDII